MSLASGFTDWQPGAQRLSNPLFFGTGQAFTTDVTLGVFYVGNWRSIIFDFQPTDVTCQATFNWSLDAAGSQLLASRSHTVNAQSHPTIVEPVRAPWLTITIHQNNTALTSHFNLAIEAADNDAATARLFLGTNLKVSNAVSVPANSSTTVSFSEYGYGQAFWHIKSSAASWSAELQALQISGAVQGKVDRFESSGGASQSRLIALPRLPGQVVLTNNDASAQTFDINVLAVVS